MTKSALADAIENSAEKSEYDAECKKLLGQKQIIALILKDCVPEYENVSVEDIEKLYIEGDPKVCTVPVMPDETNNPAIRGRNTEDTSSTEGKVYFDIVVDAVSPQDNAPIQMIINIEAQRGDDNLPYHLVTRGVYYGCRLISSQKDKVFRGSNYQGICKVYSIWVVLNPRMEERASLMCYDIKESALFGNFTEQKSCYDLLALRMLYLHPDVMQNPKGILRLLAILLRGSIKPTDKEKMLAEEFGLKMTDGVKSEVEKMGNLGELLVEETRKGIVFKMMHRLANEKRISKENADMIADCTSLSIGDVEKLASERGFVVEA